MENFGVRFFAERNPEFIAVVDPNGAEWSRDALQNLANGFARALCAAGLAPGDCVAVVAPNCAHYLGVVLGGLAAGLYVVPINWHLADDETAYVLRDSGAKAVVVHERLGQVRLAALREMCADIGVRVVAGGESAGFLSLHEFVAPHGCAALENRTTGRVLPYTSATTGRPKGVSLPLESAERALRKIVAWHRSLGTNLEDGNVHLCASMLYHSAPLEGALIALQMGHRVVLLDGWTPELLLQAIERHAVTTTFLVPAMLVRLLKLPRDVRDRYDVSSLRFVVHGGAPCPVEVKRRMLDWWGPIIWEAYGAAEAQGVIASPSQWLAHPGTVGKAIEGCTIKVLDESGAEMPAHTPGLVYLTRHTGDRFEYRGDPARTRSVHRGDFVTAGDIGYLDHDGFLFILDRRDDLIISSGMNVYPAEIEQVLVQHQDVADCAVIGMPHELFGSVPKAAVLPMPHATPGADLTAALLRFLAERLAPMKLPRRIDFVTALPRDPNGKLQRRRLREQLI